MTTISFLLGCPREAVTWERICDLVSQNPTEGVSLEYKEADTNQIIKSIAAMANTYGGIVLVGIKDKIGPDRISGVPEKEMSRLVDNCRNQLEPPFSPEIIPVRVPDSDNRFVFVLRVFPESARRPIVMNGKVYIRLHGRNDAADQSRIRQLFMEDQVAYSAQNSYIQPPNYIPEDPPIDILFRAGLFIPIDPVSAGRPLSEKSVTKLKKALNQSAISVQLERWVDKFDVSTHFPFRKEGFNRSRIVRLVWHSIIKGGNDWGRPFECVVQINSSSTGIHPPKFLELTLDVIIRATSLIKWNNPSRWVATDVATLALADFYLTLDAIIVTLMESELLAALAELSGVDVQLVPRPMNVHIHIPRGIPSVLKPHGLRPVPDSSPSYGVNLLGDPSLNIANDGDRKRQIDQWMIELALDGSLEGMENLLTEYHREFP